MQASQTLKYPVVKFLCHAMSFLSFLALIVLVTVESSASASATNTLNKSYHEAFLSYETLYNK
jgi:hypothetical protein